MKRSAIEPMHEDARSRETLLAVVRVDASQRAVEGASKSADSWTMFADLPPSSRMQGFSCAPGRLHDRRAGVRAPGEADHVDSGCATSAAPVTAPRPLTRLTTPGGRPAS